MTLNIEAIKARCKAALCPECDGRGSVPDRPGYSVLCVCADGLSEDGEDMPVGQFVRDLREAVAEVGRLSSENTRLRIVRDEGSQAMRAKPIGNMFIGTDRIINEIPFIEENEEHVFVRNGVFVHDKDERKLLVDVALRRGFIDRIKVALRVMRRRLP